MASSLTRTSSPSPPSLECFNMNCYRVFSTEKSLRAHLRHSDSCKRYMMSLDSNTLRDRPYASCRETVYASQLRKGYGVESMRLNPTMSTKVPLFSPYDEFDYDAFYAGNDNNMDDVIADEDDGLAMDDAWEYTSTESPTTCYGTDAHSWPSDKRVFSTKSNPPRPPQHQTPAGCFQGS